MTLKVIPEAVINKIEKTDYCHAHGTTTVVCSLVLKSGFVVVGVAACLELSVFDLEVGKELAYQDAVRKLFEFEAYLIKENHYLNQKEQANGSN